MRLAIKIFVAQSLVILVVAGVMHRSSTEVATLRTAHRDISMRNTGAERIEVSVREGEGRRFRVYLPRAPRAAATP